MQQTIHSLVWTEEEEEATAWPQDQNNNNTIANHQTNPLDSIIDYQMSTFPNFRSVLALQNDDEWYINNHHETLNLSQTNQLLNPLDYSASSSPSPAASIFSSSNTYFSHPNPNIQIQSIFNSFDNNGLFDFLDPHSFPDLTSNQQFVAAPDNQFHLLQEQENNGMVYPSLNDDSLFLNRSKLVKPNLDSIAAAQPTLFQKRAALRKNMGGNGVGNYCKGKNGGLEEREANDSIVDGSGGLNYDSDGPLESSEMEEISKLNGGDQKGRTKKKGLPAKNLMAERRRRKKLNDRLYMLRSVVPKISKMDRASILGDAVEYLKQLLQKINNLHTELESSPPAGSSTSSFYPLTPTYLSLPNHIKEELCSNSIADPNSQPTRVEVRAREGRAVNIHMLCRRKPGLLLSTMRVLDILGLDVQQAVISCFNGFAMDIFRAEVQPREGQDIHPEQIKAMLMESAGLLA